MPPDRSHSGPQGEEQVFAGDRVADGHMQGLHDPIHREVTVVCIFMASIMRSLSPFAIFCPTVTATVATNPGMGAGIWQGSARSALGRLLV